MIKLPLNIDFTDKVVVVTGAGGLICGAMARAFAQCGAKVAALDLNEEAVKKLANELKEEGFSYRHLSKKYGYSEELIKSWVSKYKKQNNTYNSDHIEEKYEINKDFFEAIKPDTILDLFCGRNRFWANNYGSKCKVISNDNLKDRKADPDYKMTMNADQLLQAYLVVDKHFDLIDI